MRIRGLLSVGLVLLGCGVPPEEGGTGGGGGAATSCAASATLKNDVMNGRTVVTATGSVSCTAATGIQVETCLQWDQGGTFTDVKCVSASERSVTTLSTDSAAGCLGTKRFRARVVGNGKEALSAEQSVTCL